MENNPAVEPVVEPVIVEPTVEPVVETTPSKNDLLRELSKEHGINLFDAEGIAKFKTYQDSQKSEQDKLQEEIKTLNDEKVVWQSSKLEYESKLKASELGIPHDKLSDALTLAGGDVSKLEEVLKKYPIFKSTEGIKIGVQDPNKFQNPNANTEAAEYMAANPNIYGKK